MTVKAGENIEQKVSLTNLSGLPDNFDLDLEGISESWYNLSMQSVYLFPNWSEPVTLRLEIPPSAEAGFFILRFNAASRTQPAVRTQTDIELIILPGQQPTEPAPDAPFLNIEPPFQNAPPEPTRPPVQPLTYGPPAQPGGLYGSPPVPPATFSGYGYGAPVPPPPTPADNRPAWNGQSAQPLYYNQPARPPQPGYPTVPLQPPAIPPRPPTGSLSGGRPPGRPSSKRQPPDVKVKLETAVMSLPAGESVEQQVQISNLTGVTGEFEVNIEGLPANWFNFSTNRFMLYPDWSESFYLRIGVGREVKPQTYVGYVITTSPTNPQFNKKLYLEVVVLPALAVVPVAPQDDGRSPAPGDSGKVVLELQTTRMAIPAGEIGEQQISLRNLALTPDSFDIKLEGLPAEWYSLSSTNFYLFPKWNEEFYLRLNIPYEVRPALYRARVVVSARNQPRLWTQLPFELEVLPPIAPRFDKRPTGLLQSQFVAPPELNFASAEPLAPPPVEVNVRPSVDPQQIESAPPVMPLETTAPPPAAEPDGDLEAIRDHATPLDVTKMFVASFEPQNVLSLLEPAQAGAEPDPKEADPKEAGTAEDLPEPVVSPPVAKRTATEPQESAEEFATQAIETEEEGQELLIVDAALLFPFIGKIEPEPEPEPEPDPESKEIDIFEKPRVDVQLGTTHFKLLPGETVAYAIKLFNLTPTLDNFEIVVEGMIPEEWYQLSAQTINLFPTWNEKIDLRWSIPPNVSPATYQGKLKVTSLSQARVSSEIELSLTVLDTVEEAEAVETLPATEESAAVEAGTAPAEFSAEEKAEFQVGLASGRKSTAKPTDEQLAEREKILEEEREAARERITSGKRPTAKLGQLVAALNLSPAAHVREQPKAEQPSFISLPVIPREGELEPGQAAPVGPTPPKRSFFQRLFGGGQSPRQDPALYAAIAPAPVQNPGAPGAFYQPMGQPAEYGPDGRLDVEDLFRAPQPGSPNQPGAVAPANWRANGAPVTPPPGDRPTVFVQLQKYRMTLVAGDTLEQEISLVNQTVLPDDFELTIEGIPAGWFSFSRNQINLFPNWSESSTLRIEVSERVRPNIYAANVIVVSKTQPAVRSEVKLEIEVLAPLNLQARLQPHRARGFKANYNLIIRNRSMSDGLMNLQMSPSNPYCEAVFTPPQVRIGGGKSATVNLKVGLKPKTPSDQARQSQSFELAINPEWYVAGVAVKTPEVLVEGEYRHQSRWAFIGRHPFLFSFSIIALLIWVFWSLLILPFIQTTLLFGAIDTRVFYQGRATPLLRVEQKSFSDQVQNGINPIGAFTTLSVQFRESDQKVRIEIRFFFMTADMLGELKIDPNSGDLVFKSDVRGQEDSFPWAFAPPDEAVKRINAKLKDWLINRQSPSQRVDRIFIEGNTLYLQLKNCATTDKACFK